MKIDRSLFLSVCAFLFALPAVLGLATQAWQSEAGSLSPLILCLGLWTLWHAVRANIDCAQSGSLRRWGAVMIPALIIYMLASAINMVALMALAGWLALCVSFYAVFGFSMVRKCAFPLLFLGLIVPLPYSLSVQMNAGLREWISQASVHLAGALGMDVALGRGVIMVEQYVLAVENACAGTSSTMSLIAIGVLFAYWIGRVGSLKSLGVAVLAVPIALAANVLRVVFLLALVSWFGSPILDTFLHPLSGVISFIIAAIFLALSAKALNISFGLRGGQSSPSAGT